MVGKLKYFCIKERDVSEWNTYSERGSKDVNSNKIIFFNDFKNLLTK